MITKISYIKDIKTLKSVIFLYGNFDFYKNSFVNFLTKEFQGSHEVKVIKTCDEIQPQNIGLFGPVKDRLYILNVTDKMLDNLKTVINFSNTKDRFILIDTDFRKTKKISAEFQKSKDVESIAFFENSSKDYLVFLFNFFALSRKIDFSELDLYLKSQKEDPFKFAEKMSLLKEEDLIRAVKNHANVNNHSVEMEPISLLRFLSASLKFSNELKILPKHNKRLSKEEIFAKLMNLEIFYKRNNVKSKIFISKDFL